MWWIKKSQSISASRWLIAGPWFTVFFWWIPSAATSWYFMWSSIRNRFANPILLILVRSLSLLWWDPLWLQDRLLVWGKLWKIKLQFLFRKILRSPLQDLLIVIPDTLKESKDVPYVSLKSVVLTKRKDNLKKLKSCCGECGNPVCEKLIICMHS